MKISKTQFIEYLNKEKLLERFLNLETKEILEEELEKYKMELSLEKSELDTPEEYIKVMLPYYKKVEELATQYVKKHYQGNVIANEDTKKQKSFSTVKNKLELYCYLDAYQEDDTTVRIFETKATTSDQFLKRSYSSGKDKKVFFTNENNKITYQKPQIDSQSISDKIESLYDLSDDIGKYIYDLTYQRYVIENSEAYNKLKKYEYYLIVLNSEYIYDGLKDSNNQNIYGEDILCIIDLTELTKEALNKINKDVLNLVEDLKYIESNKDNISKLENEFQKNERLLPSENSIDVYLYSHLGFKDKETGRIYTRDELIENGWVHALDIPEKLLSRENNLIQRKVIETGMPYYNYEKIQAGLNQLKYPIYHLDFESFPCPIPRYKGEKPYSQSLFQFSIHIERSPGNCDVEKDSNFFLASNHLDHRRELTEKLLDVIKNDGGSILVYNQAFEKTRISELSILFPQYKERLSSINDRIFDLLYIIKGNDKFYTGLGYNKKESKTINFYHEKLNGSYSIKKVLPIFSELTYEQLNIKNGNEAIIAYAKFPLMTKEEYTKEYHSLLEYCRQDTYAMVEILKKLRKITGEKNA